MNGLYFLAAAYTAIWLLLFGYVFTLSRRAGRLERELEGLRRDPPSR